MIAFPKRGLYGITQAENKPAEALFVEVSAAIRGGVAAIQYRDKQPKNALNVACGLVDICHQANIPLIINDDVELAYQAKADGVHLGKHDSDIKKAQERLGKTAIIGVSCYNDVELAQTAQSLGASYVAFGRFFPSLSKPLAPPADKATLSQAKARLHVPIVAIGGILPENGGELLAAGADVLAVIGGIFDRDPEQSARAYQHLFSE